jgi:hypothetical protein
MGVMIDRQTLDQRMNNLQPKRCREGSVRKIGVENREIEEM